MRKYTFDRSSLTNEKDHHYFLNRLIRCMHDVIEGENNYFLYTYVFYCSINVPVNSCDQVGKGSSIL